MVNASVIKHYFPDISVQQYRQFESLYALYADLNAKINVISRKDMDNFYLHHVLHSLALTKFYQFETGKSIIDIGTGGGFPAVPLAIMFPEIEFTACDSIAKKVTVVNTVAAELKLNNIKGLNVRVEQIKEKFDIATARAVAPAQELWQWMQKNWKHENHKQMVLLKGGDLSEELMLLNARYPGIKNKQYAIASVYEEPFFETKKVICLTQKS